MLHVNEARFSFVGVWLACGLLGCLEQLLHLECLQELALLRLCLHLLRERSLLQKLSNIHALLTLQTSVFH